MKCYTVEPPRKQEELRAFVEACDQAFEREMEAVAEQIAAVSELKLLGLTGPTCSGKTTAAKKLTDCLEAHGHRVHVISVDDFYYDKNFLQRRAEDDPNIEIDYDSEDTIDIGLLAEKTGELLSGVTTRMPRFDFRSGLRVEGITLSPCPEDVFLFEGIQILYPKVRKILSGNSYRSIYICPNSSIQVGGECFLPNEIRLMRRLVRDYRYRSSMPDFTFYLWQSVRENEEKNIFPNKDNCHAFIDSTMPYEIGMLKPYLSEILSQVAEGTAYYESAQALLQRLASVEPIPSDYMTQNSLYKEFI